jgi:hypothetical protein
LKLGFVCNGATCKLDAGTAKRMPGLDTGGPVRVAVRNSNGGIVLSTIIYEEVFEVAVDCWEWTVWQFRARLCMQEVNDVQVCRIQILDGVLQAVIVVFRWV